MQRKGFTEEQRMDILREWIYGDESQEDVADRHGIHKQTIARWHMRYGDTVKEEDSPNGKANR